MSKYEHFLNMKTYVFLIILGFIQLVFSNHDLNISDELYSVCPVRWIRRKRAEYTRWGGGIVEITSEFVVKVLDEELTTSQPIVAVNIQSAPEGADKLIIGSGNIPSPTTLMSITNDLREYTRFVAPTTVSERDQRVHIAPVSHTTGQIIIQSLQPQGYYSQRDDSPPASPQFIARTPKLVARQYAPIEPVAFARRASMTPFTPPTMPIVNTLPPTKTWPHPPMPMRNKADFQDIRTLQAFDDDPAFVTRSTYTNPERTKLFEVTDSSDIDEEFPPTTKNFEDSRKQLEQLQKNAVKDFEASYNMMFYNDEDTISGKKEDQDGIEGDYYKKPEDDAIDQDISDTKEGIDLSEYKNTTDMKELQNYIDDDALDNFTGKPKSKVIIGSINQSVSEKTKARRRPFCNLLKLRQLNFNSPRTLPEIVNQLKMWAEDSPVAKWIDITDGNLTNMENPIYMMIVDDPSSGQIVTAKQTVMVVAGIQGRDHHAVAAAMYVLYQLIERSEAHSDLLTKYRFWIIPVFNPDGYDYSMTFPQKRGWMKNLRQQWDTCKGREACKFCETRGLRCTIHPCYGVNLDRNFEYQWIPAEELRAEHPCGGLYAGTRQLSEAETRALTHFLHEQHTPLFTFIAFKEGDVLGIMYPYSHTRKKRAFDHVYRQRAIRAAAAAYSISNRPYVAGQTSEFLPLYAGGIEDWIDGHLGIENTYVIMMFRLTDSYNSKLITERVVHETYAAMDTLLLQSLDPLGPAPAVTLTRTAYCPRILPEQLLYITAVYFILLLNG